jgi:DNA (cytosine-5)-methyltransferase 1
VRWPAEIASTLNAHYGDKWGLEDQHALGGAALFVPAVSVTGEISHTLKAEGFDASEDGTGRGNPIIAFEVAGTMKALQGSGGWSNSVDHAAGGYMVPMAQTVALRGRDGGATAELGGEVATALRASQGGGDKPHVLTSAVRRLTPVECERLQGFPDNWTRIPMPQRGKKAGPVWAADGPRYKALGNSMAVPVMHWIGARIDRFMPREQAEPVAAPVRKTLRFTAAGRMVFE